MHLKNEIQTLRSEIIELKAEIITLKERKTPTNIDEYKPKY